MKTYYTYLHRRGDTNEVFYVGKGTGIRAYRTYHKDNPAWHDIVARYGYRVEIIEEFTDQKDALIAETELLQKYAGGLVNKQLRSIVAKPTKNYKYCKRPINTEKYTQLGDIWVDLADYHSRLATDKKTGCLEVVRGPLHNQGYMMIGAVRESDRKRIMTTGNRIAGRLKAGRDLAVTEMVLKTCSNPKCHNPEHLMIGNKLDMMKIMKKNDRLGRGVGPRERRYRRNGLISPADLYYIQNHTVEESMARFNFTKNKVRDIQGRIRRGSYAWLHQYDSNGNLKPEFEHLYIAYQN